MPHFEYETGEKLAGLSESFGEATAGNVFVEYSKKVYSSLSLFFSLDFLFLFSLSCLFSV